jgi:histidinol-phosphate aminotransferase
MNSLHPLARTSLSRLEPLDPILRARRHQTAMVDAHSSTNPYGGEYAHYPSVDTEALRAGYVAFLQAECRDRQGDGVGTSLTRENVLLTAGSGAALELIFRAFLDPGQRDQICITSPAFQFYAHQARLMDLGIVDVPLRGQHLDTLHLEGIAAASAKVTFLCSPNNPVGSTLTLQAIQQVLERANGIVVVDEAYIEFAKQGSAASLVVGYPNLIVTRTFSKAWGLAGVRAGAVIADPLVIRTLSLVQLPFSLNAAARLALEQKLADPAPVLETVAVLNASKRRLAEQLAQIAIVRKVFPSDANFLLVEVADGNDVYERLIQHGLLVTHAGWAVPNTLRLSIGTEADCQKLATCFAQISATRRGPTQ